MNKKILLNQADDLRHSIRRLEDDLDDLIDDIKDGDYYPTYAEIVESLQDDLIDINTSKEPLVIGYYKHKKIIVSLLE